MNDRNRFDKFTERARKVLSLAQEEAQRLQHNYIGTERLELGRARERKGVAAKVLSSLGVELNKVRYTIEFMIGRGYRIVLGELGLTPRAKEVIELAVDEAHRLNHHYVGIEHLLLGLRREGEGIAAGVLESLGITLEKARAETLRVLGDEAGQQQSQNDKASMQPPGEESTASSQQPLQDDDDKAQELSQEEKDFIQTLGALSKDERDRL